MFYFIQTIKEYVLSILLFTISMFIIPQNSLILLQNGLIGMLTLFPITITNILLMNMMTMITIFICGMIHEKLVSMFVVFNGMALAIMISVYQNHLDELLQALFPHTVVETLLMLIFCTLIKLLSLALKSKNKNLVKKYTLLIIMLCVPLWLLAGILEVIFFENM